MAASTVIGAMTVNVNANTKDFARKMASAARQVKATQSKIKAYSSEMDKAIAVNQKAFARKRFVVPVKRAGDELDKTAKKAFKLSKAAKVASAAFAVIGSYVSLRSIRRIAETLGETAKELDKFQKTTQKLGVSSEGLGGLHLAAKMTGVSIETMNMALQRMTRRVAEAAKGTGEAKGALKELGIDAKQLMQLPLEVQFREISLAMESVGTRADRVRLAMKLFDSEGVALVNTLDLGEKGMAALAAESIILGQSVSGENLVKVTKMNDQLSKLLLAFSGKKNELLITIAPAATTAIEGLLQLAKYQGTKGGGYDLGASTLFKVWGIFNPGVAEFNQRVNAGGRSGVMARAQRANAAKQARVEEDLIRDAMNEKGFAKLRREKVERAEGKFLNRFAKGVQDTIGGKAITGNGIFDKARWYGRGVMFRANRLKRFERPEEEPGVKKRSSNNILERGTAEAFNALRANLGGKEDQQLKLAQKGVEQRDTLIDVFKRVVFPQTASI